MNKGLWDYGEEAIEANPLHHAVESNTVRLLCVDAYGLLYRGYYALERHPLLTRNGDNTSAVFSFMRSLLQAAKEVKATHIAVALDMPGATFRHTLYPDYKANRPPTPEAIVWGGKKMEELLKAMGVAVLGVEGFEADDVIGSLATRFAGEACEVYMLTSDKDYQQLLGEGCYMLKPNRKDTGYSVIKEADICEKYHLQSAEEFALVLALWGDTSDNIPGVPGVGEKTAARLVAKYHTLSTLYSRIEEERGRLKENLLKHREGVQQSLQLVTIRRDVEVPSSLEHYLPQGGDLVAFNDLVAALEFKQLGRDLREYFFHDDDIVSPEEESEEVGAATAEVLEERQYTVIESEASFQAMIKALRKADYIALDVESTGLNVRHAQLVCLTLSVAPQQGYFVPFPLAESWHAALRTLCSEERNWVGHNLKFDIAMLAQHGLPLRGHYFDTMLMHFLLDPSSAHSLDALAPRYLDVHPLAFDEVVPHVREGVVDWDAVPREQLVAYAVEDSDVTLRLFYVLWPLVQKEGFEHLYRHIEAPLIGVLSAMECAGVYMEPARLQHVSAYVDEEVTRLSNQIASYAQGEEINIDSPKQVGELLFDTLQLGALLNKKPKLTPTGQYSTNELELKKYLGVHPVVEELLRYREVRKLQHTYVHVLPSLVDEATGCIHCQFNQMVTLTGRLSSSKPNLQQIPVRDAVGRQIREAFVSRFPKGVIVCADYSQMELRVLAHRCEDEHLVAAFQEGVDIHRATASRVYNVPMEEVTAEQRAVAKEVNFSIIYGTSGFGLAQRLGLEVGEATEFIQNYFTNFAGIKEYMDHVKEFVHTHEYVKTLSGRKRYFVGVAGYPAMRRAMAERDALNTTIQGSAAEIIKLAMLAISKHIAEAKLQALLVLQVHDELIFDCPYDEVSTLVQIVKEDMQGALPLKVPLEVEVRVGDSWGGAELYKENDEE